MGGGGKARAMGDAGEATEKEKGHPHLYRHHLHRLRSRHQVVGW
jgi:hypothetical protein